MMLNEMVQDQLYDAFVAISHNGVDLNDESADKIDTQVYDEISGAGCLDVDFMDAVEKVVHFDNLESYVPTYLDKITPTDTSTKTFDNQYTPAQLIKAQLILAKTFTLATKKVTAMINDDNLGTVSELLTAVFDVFNQVATLYNDLLTGTFDVDAVVNTQSATYLKAIYHTVTDTDITSDDTLINDDLNCIVLSY